MEPDRLLYNGVEMHIARVRALEPAQAVHAFGKGAAVYPRDRHGDEEDDRGAGRGEFRHGCGSRAGQRHALGCNVERCLVCCDHDWDDGLDA